MTAAAALAISQDPSLEPSQVSGFITRSAVDVGSPGRDAATGSGRIDVASLLEAVTVPPAPIADELESNDDAGERAATVALRSRRVIDATIDAFDDPSDVYRVYLRRGARLTVSLTGALGGRSTLVLWRPGTEHIAPVTAVAVQSGAILAWRKGVKPVLRRIPIESAGWYYVEVKSPPRSGRRLPADPGCEASGIERSSRALADSRLQQLVVGNLADLPRGVADDDRSRRDVAEHHCAGADEGLVSDLDARQQHGAAADPGAAPDRRARGAGRAAARFSPCSCRSSSSTHGATNTSSSRT